MSSSQQDVTREVLHSVHDFLGGPAPDGDEWCFEFAEHLHSNWGAVYGGALAASTLAVARSAAPDRSPRSLHIQIVRSVPSGMAYATAEVRHSGRTVATMQVDMFDARRKLAVVALVTMVTPDALAADFHNTAAEPFRRHVQPLALEPGFMAPVQKSLQMLTEADGAFVGSYADWQPRYCCAPHSWPRRRSILAKVREHLLRSFRVVLEDENAVALRERQAWSLAADVVGRRHRRDALAVKFGKDFLCLHDARNAEQFHDPLVVVMVGTVRFHDTESCMRRDAGFPGSMTHCRFSAGNALELFLS